MPKIIKSKINSELKYNNTSEIIIPKNIADQIIGQDEALKIAKKAAIQRRNILLIGEPGTGKSLIGQAIAESVPANSSIDILCLPNEQDENNPLIRVMPRGKGKELVNKLKMQANASTKGQNVLFIILLVVAVISPWWIRKQYGDILAAASLIGSMIFLAVFVLFMGLNKRMGGIRGVKIPKLLVDSSEFKKAPFIDATGAKAGALLGDVLHDPLQSFLSSNKITQVVSAGKNQVQLKEGEISIVDELLEKHKEEVIRKGSYEAVFLNKNEINLLGEKNDLVEEVGVLSANKYKTDRRLIKLTTETGKELIVTPEHKVAIKDFFNKIKYVEAGKLKSWHKVIILG